MVRRGSTILAALAVALLIYAIFSGLIFHRVMTRLVHVTCIHHPRSTTPATTAQPNQPPPSVPIFGVRVPVSAIIAAVVTCLMMPLFAEFMNHCRRRRRERNDQCIDCGYQLTTWRGRCPGCGVRIGPG